MRESPKKSNVSEPQEGQVSEPKVSESTTVWWDELNAAAVARKSLIVELFPSDIGASVLPSAESTFFLPGLMSWSTDEGPGSQVVMTWGGGEAPEAKVTAMSGEPMELHSVDTDESWSQLMTYVTSLTDAVLKEESHSSVDVDWLTGSEQPTPD